MAVPKQKTSKPKQKRALPKQVENEKRPEEGDDEEDPAQSELSLTEERIRKKRKVANELARLSETHQAGAR